MYKGSSRSLQRRHAVDKPLATGGYIGIETPDEIIPSADNMSREDCLAEQRQIKLELAKVPNARAVAAANKDAATERSLNLRYSSLCGRLGLVNKRLHTLTQADEHQAFCDATREIVTPEQWVLIVARKEVLRASAEQDIRKS